MYLAADRIDRLANRRADRNVLVNCFYGQNRSGAAVVAWLVLKRGFSCDDAIALLRKREREDRGDVDTPQKTLRNANFVALLHELSAASRVAHDRAYAEQYAEFKNELASRGFWFVGGVPMSRQKPVARPGNLTGEQFGCRTFFAAAPVESAGRACKWLSREAAGRACRWCGAVDAPMFWCSGCGTTATYCSRRCQALHLVAHAREDGCRGATRVLRSRRY